MTDQPIGIAAPVPTAIASPVSAAGPKRPGVKRPWTTAARPGMGWLKAAWPRPGIVRLMLLYTLAVLAGAAIIMARFPLPDGALVLTQAEFVPTLPAGVAAPSHGLTVDLPHRCWTSETGVCSGDYRLTFHHPANAEPGQWSIFLPLFSGNALVSVNGVDLGDSRHFQTGAVIHQAGPMIVPIPMAVLRPGENEAVIRLDVWNQISGFLDHVLVGPDSVVRPAYAAREMALGTLPRLMVAWQAALCLSLLIVWIGRREEWIHLQMSVVLGFGLIQGLPLFIASLDWPEWLLRSSNLTGVWQGALLPGIMARLVGRPLPVSNARLLLLPAVFTVAYAVMITDPANLQPWFTGLFLGVAVPAMLGLMGWSAWIIVVAAFRRGHPAARFILGGMIVVLIMAGHDLLVFTGVVPGAYPLLGRYLATLLLTVISATLMWRFAMALTEVSRFNEVLRQEVTAAEAALRASFEREQVQTRATALESERLRLTRDLHDGLAGQLVSIVAQCGLPTRDYDRIAVAARRALDDLRLVVASLDDVGNDLGMMLAAFHERIEPQLVAQGIELRWQMAPLPDIEGLRSEHALALFRILQEAVTNAVRHSGSTAITIAMAPAERPDRAVRIVVSDRGYGFTAERQGGHGLNNMRRRAASLGADLTVDSGPGGTRVVMDLPHVLPGMGGRV